MHKIKPFMRTAIVLAIAKYVQGDYLELLSEYLFELLTSNVKNVFENIDAMIGDIHELKYYLT
jgi:hypothetical protein